MRMVSSDAPRTPAPRGLVIEFPPRVKYAFAAAHESGEYWVGGVDMTDGGRQMLLEASPGGMTHYALVAKMHEVASKNGVDLHVVHPDGTEEVLGPAHA